MSESNKVADHYSHGSLIATIEQGVVELGKTTESIGIDDLALVDEFHIGGRQASTDFLDQLDLSDQDHVLDVGCGIGGASRFVASHYGPRVIGIDLTEEYIETGRELCNWVGLEQLVSLQQGSALHMPFADQSFDHAYMMHVGMNIEDKAALAAEVARVLKPGASFGIYDVMRITAGDLTFPVPWATTAQTSAVATPEDYEQSLVNAGFVITAQRNRFEFSIQFFEQLRAKVAAAGGPPPLGLHLLMGDTAQLKVKNMLENISAGRVAPVEIIARKA